MKLEETLVNRKLMLQSAGAAALASVVPSAASADSPSPQPTGPEGCCAAIDLTFNQGSGATRLANGVGSIKIISTKSGDPQPNPGGYRLVCSVVSGRVTGKDEWSNNHGNNQPLAPYDVVYVFVKQ